MLRLYLKHVAVATPLEPIGRRLRWLAGVPQRFRHPELWDLYLEDRRTRTALAALVEPGDTCVDVGAHIGSTLAELCRLAPGGSHHAFEPVPYKARWLRRKFPSVTVVEAATSDENGVARFFDAVDRPGFSSLQRPVGDHRIRNYEVEVVRLDDELAELERIDLLKIDVEGAELPTLRGANDLLRRHRPVVLFECGPDLQLQHFGYKRPDLFDFFSELGYDLYSIVDHVYGRAPMTPESFHKAATYPFRGFNYLALPAGTAVTRLL